MYASRKRELINPRISLCYFPGELNRSPGLVVGNRKVHGFFFFELLCLSREPVS